jgi:hypothetical protein
MPLPGSNLRVRNKPCKKCCWVVRVVPQLKTMRITPSMAAGLRDHVWVLEEIVMIGDGYLPKPGRRGPYKKKNEQ